MKKIFILGAGLVAGPTVRYLLERTEFEIRVADVEHEKAARLVGGHSRGSSVGLDLRNHDAVRREIEQADIIISMVPYAFHPVIAGHCLGSGKHLITASYVGPAMKSLDAKVKEKGLVFLNELGLDPGIDHMEALRIIHEVKSRGGIVEEFTSYCGGIPSPEANTNPFGYKFSWSPMGVLQASKNPARFLMKGEIMTISPERLFADPVPVSIPGVGVLEGYPNRDSVPYAEIYGIPETRTIVRGTLRYPGWCLAMKKLGELGFLDQEVKDLRGVTFSGFLRGLMPASAGKDLKRELTGLLKLEGNPEVVDSLEWLGLLSDGNLPFERGSALDILAHAMIEKLRYLPGERDMIVLQHDFLVSYPGPSKERIFSTLIDFGVPFGDSAMSRTVGLPVAIAAKLLLEGRIHRAGVQIPDIPEIYLPLLEELRTFGIAFKQKHTEEGRLS